MPMATNGLEVTRARVMPLSDMGSACSNACSLSCRYSWMPGGCSLAEDWAWAGAAAATKNAANTNVNAGASLIKCRNGRELGCLCMSATLMFGFRWASLPARPLDGKPLPVDQIRAGQQPQPPRDLRVGQSSLGPGYCAGAGAPPSAPASSLR